MNHGVMALRGHPPKFSRRRIPCGKTSGLRLPRIGHLMDILQNQDDFELGDAAYTIAGRERSLVHWRDHAEDGMKKPWTGRFL